MAKTATNPVIVEIENLEQRVRAAEGRAVNAEQRAAAAEKRAAELTVATEESALASMRFAFGVISEPNLATGNEIVYLVAANLVVRISEVTVLLNGAPKWSEVADELDSRGDGDEQCRTMILASGRFLIALMSDAEFARLQNQIGRK